ncbi:MAG: DUF2249 domain-containing protein [Bacteriovorax sp.]|nr:DUF2249 domain-containing protein [Bacteriovorax sp.]
MFNFYSPKKTQTIDCRNLLHPVPWQKVSKALHVLQTDEKLHILYEHTPNALIHLLGEMGLKYKIIEKKVLLKKQVEILIWKNH